VHKTREIVEGAEKELRQALDKINSTNHDQILSGLQTLAILRDPELQIKALSRLTELITDDDPIIATQAKATIEKMAPMSLENSHNAAHNGSKADVSQ
jgi:hypothetical protein